MCHVSKQKLRSNFCVPVCAQLDQKCSISNQPIPKHQATFSLGFLTPNEVDNVALGNKTFSICLSLVIYPIKAFWDAWVAQLSVQLWLKSCMISRFFSLSSAWGSLLTAQSLEPASDSVSASLSAPPLLALCLSLSLFTKNK